MSISALPSECFHPNFKNGQDGVSGSGSDLSDSPPGAEGGDLSPCRLGGVPWAVLTTARH